MKLREEYTCPLELTHDIIKGKWKPIIIWQLGKKNMSLSNLETEIKGISQKMLLEHLKELQQFGMIDKQEFQGYPLKVEYSLTNLGKRMLMVVEIMQDVGIEFMKNNGLEKPLRDNGLI
jgi:DNA-binding HxlR family transcriptional regulator